MATTFVQRGIQISLFGHDGRNDLLMHSFHARATHNPVTLADCNTVANIVAAWVDSGTDDLVGLLHESTFVDRVVATAIDTLNGPQAEKAIGAIGTQHNAPLPSEVTLALKKAGTTRGRTRRGRFFAWPATISDLDAADSNLFDASYVSRALATYNALLAQMAVGAQPLVVYSERDGALYDVSSIVAVDHLVDHQDRRAAVRGR